MGASLRVAFASWVCGLIGIAGGIAMLICMGLFWALCQAVIAIWAFATAQAACNLAGLC